MSGELNNRPGLYVAPMARHAAVSHTKNERIRKMTTKRRFSRLHSSITLALVMIGALISTACNSGAPATSGNTPVAGAPGAPTKAVASAANTPAGSTTNANLDCQAIVNAAFDLNGSEPFLVTLAGAGGSVVNSVDSSMYVDTA